MKGGPWRLTASNSCFTGRFEFRTPKCLVILEKVKRNSKLDCPYSPIGRPLKNQRYYEVLCFRPLLIWGDLVYMLVDFGPTWFFNSRLFQKVGSYDKARGSRFWKLNYFHRNLASICAKNLGLCEFTIRLRRVRRPKQFGERVCK